MQNLLIYTFASGVTAVVGWKGSPWRAVLFHSPEFTRHRL